MFHSVQFLQLVREALAATAVADPAGRRALTQHKSQMKGARALEAGMREMRSFVIQLHKGPPYQRALRCSRAEVVVGGTVVLAELFRAGLATGGPGADNSATHGMSVIFSSVIFSSPFISRCVMG